MEHERLPWLIAGKRNNCATHVSVLWRGGAVARVAYKEKRGVRRPHPTAYCRSDLTPAFSLFSVHPHRSCCGSSRYGWEHDGPKKPAPA